TATAENYRMKRRWLCLSLVLLLLAVGVFMVPSARWSLYGWVRGEAFYQNRPTSWWAEEIEVNYERIYLASSFPISDTEATWCIETQPSLRDRLWERFAADDSVLHVAEVIYNGPLLDGD